MKLRAPPPGWNDNGPSPPSSHGRGPAARRETHVIVISETVWKSLVRDAGSLAVCVALIGIGVWFGSTIMQAFGALVALFLLATVSYAKLGRRLTVDQARSALDAIERGET